MARPKEFDREQVLDIAKALFWEKGFEATSTEDLRRAMGIGRQSFYDSFKGKREIFLEVLRRYNADGVQACVTTLRSAASPLEALEELLYAFANEPPERRALGCLGVTAMADFGTSDEDVAEIGRSNAATLETVLETLLREAQGLGLVRASLAPKAAARQLQATITGMKVVGKAGASAEVLHDIACSALDGLKAGAPGPSKRPRAR